MLNAVKHLAMLYVLHCVQYKSLIKPYSSF